MSLLGHVPRLKFQSMNRGSQVWLADRFEYRKLFEHRRITESNLHGLDNTRCYTLDMNGNSHASIKLGDEQGRTRVQSSCSEGVALFRVDAIQRCYITCSRDETRDLKVFWVDKIFWILFDILFIIYYVYYVYWFNIFFRNIFLKTEKDFV